METDGSGQLVHTNHCPDERFQQNIPFRNRPPQHRSECKRQPTLRDEAQPPISHPVSANRRMTACPPETAPETHRPQAHEEQHPWPQLIERPGLEAAPGERKKYDIDGNRASLELVSDTLALTGRRIPEREAP